MTPAEQRIFDLTLQIGEAITVAEGVPEWAAHGVVGLLESALAFLQGGTDDEREAAAMKAAEALKKALDDKKFGPTTLPSGGE